jgi:hypothetical protein
VSAKVYGRVWDYVLTPQEQAVLLAMADHAHEDGSHVFPSIGYLVWKTNFSERTVQRVVKGFRTRGVLVQTRPPGFHRPAEYRIVLNSLVRKAPYRNAVHMGATETPMTGGPPGQKGDWRREKGVSESEMGVTAVTPEPSTEPPIETSVPRLINQTDGDVRPRRWYDPGDPEETRRVTRAYEAARRRGRSA